MTNFPARQPIGRTKYLGLACLLVLAGCGQAPPPAAATPDTRAADEAAVRKADEDWAKVGQTKSVDGWMGFYTDDVVLLPPNAATATGRENVRKAVAEMLGLPGLSIAWTTTKVDVAKSGDLAYSYGAYTMTVNDPKGKPMNEKGKYVEIWKKQADGGWKCAVDGWSSDAPEPPPSK